MTKEEYKHYKEQIHQKAPSLITLGLHGTMCSLLERVMEAEKRLSEVDNSINSKKLYYMEIGTKVFSISNCVDSTGKKLKKGQKGIVKVISSMCYGERFYDIETSKGIIFRNIPLSVLKADE